LAAITEKEIRNAIAQANGCAYILTSRFKNKRGGMLATSVQLCGHEPPLVCIAVRKGHRVDLLLRDSHAFGLCCIPATSRLLLRRFRAMHSPESIADPFEGLEIDALLTGAPLLKGCTVAFDCEVFRIFDLEADHELVIGLVVALRVNGSKM
jgi:flavin reductase (DIM6/NTAB) family NADH-FMN oxidoreductase RutF